ncbi:phosphoribosylaminoimidazolesuccinocarboxamide synthase [Planctomycetota bacterium]
MSSAAISQTDIQDLKLMFRGKVRDIYEYGDDLLIITSDRISAFDWVLPTPIPGKGRVLTQMSFFWFDFMKDAARNHVVNPNPDTVEQLAPYADQLKDRSMIVRRAEVVPVECVARGYITGSAWKEYKRSGTVADEKVRDGYVESDRLDEPIFTPATKAESGHDENISFAELTNKIGTDLANQLRDKTLEIYDRGRAHAESCGIILSDTKLEWGHIDGDLCIVDELLTPDSSRFWPADTYSPGGQQPSYDKQFVRDHLEMCGWDKNSDPPELPNDVVTKTAAKYEAALNALT